jgi:anti-sigma B factor antagonist
MFDIRRGEDGVIHLSGRFDAAQVKKAEPVLRAVAGTATADLSGLEYISSGGIGALLETQKRLQDSGNRLVLTNLTPAVKLVFHYAGLEEIFSIR